MPIRAKEGLSATLVWETKDLPMYPAGFPEVITLCGSTRFREAFEREQARLTDEGKIVISVGRFGHCDGLDMTGEHKKMLDELHKRKIDMSDGIHVVNDFRSWCLVCKDWCDTHRIDWVEGGMLLRCKADPTAPPGWSHELKKIAYVGESTRSEIEYALAKGKKITYLNPPG